MAILPKDYLSICDVADYFNSLNYDYDLSVSSDRYKLNKDIYDLIQQNKIKAVFRHMSIDNVKSAYFILSGSQAQAILLDDNLVSVKSFSQIYRYTTGKLPEKEEWVQITENLSISINDFYVPMIELDNLFKKSRLDACISESVNSSAIVTDTYGRKFDLNQHKQNREDDYITLGETIDLINISVNPNNEHGLSINNSKLRDLARKKKVTPCFYYHGYVGEIDFQGALHTEIIAGYFTYRLLTEEICSYDSHMELPSDGVTIYRIIERKTAEFTDYDDGLFLFYKNPNGLNNNEEARLSHVEADEIRFSKREVDSCIASLTNNNNSQDDTLAKNDSELLVKLEKLQVENDDLNARLCTARNTYKQQQNEIKALKENDATELYQLIDEKRILDLENQLAQAIAELADKPADDGILQTILDQTHEYHAPDLSHAIKLWSDLYINGKIGSDSHSNKASLWISSNTGYTDNDKSSIGRIREVATPFKDFGTKRSRENEK